MENTVLFLKRKKESRTQGSNPYRTLMLSLPKQSVFCYIHYVDASQFYVSVSLMSWGSCFPARILYWGQWLKMLAFVPIVSGWHIEHSLNVTVDYLHWICIETEVVTFSQSLSFMLKLRKL